jgi:hypothetical protein
MASASSTLGNTRETTRTRGVPRILAGDGLNASHKAFKMSYMQPERSEAGTIPAHGVSRGQRPNKFPEPLQGRHAVPRGRQPESKELYDLEDRGTRKLISGGLEAAPARRRGPVVGVAAFKCRPRNLLPSSLAAGLPGSDRDYAAIRSAASATCVPGAARRR